MLAVRVMGKLLTRAMPLPRDLVRAHPARLPCRVADDSANLRRCASCSAPAVWKVSGEFNGSHQGVAARLLLRRRRCDGDCSEGGDGSPLPRPIYIIGLIVHNRFAVEELTSLGIVTLDGPDRASIFEQVSEGTVIFTAHGVSPLVQQRAAERGLHVIDATCPDVTKTHDLVRDLAADGYQILYIGKKGHPEPEGVIGEAPGMRLSGRDRGATSTRSPSDFTQRRALAVTTQTTLSQWDTAALIAEIQRAIRGSRSINEICHATQVRQEAVAKMAAGADLTIVVGDPRSNNTNRLVQVAEELAGSPAIRVERLERSEAGDAGGEEARGDHLRRLDPQPAHAAGDPVRRGVRRRGHGST